MPAPDEKPAPKKRRSGKDTRARLLDVAYQLVREEGLEALTIRELSVRGKVAVGLPHAHFGSRDGLLDELRVRAWDEFDAVVDHVLAAHRDPQGHEFETIIRDCVRAIVRFAFTEPNLFELLMVRSRTPFTEARLEREMRTARRFVSFLVQGRDQGIFHFETDPFVFSLALWTAMTG
jgi:AcrR family transcriptional regulator